MRHTHDAKCPSCEKKLEKAHPLISHWFHEIKKEYPEIHVSWTFRTQEEQEFFFNEGSTRLRWPNSQHNAMKAGRPCARAMDLFQLRLDNVAVFPWRLYKEVSEFLKEKEAPIDWGYDLWKWDGDHFQLKKEIE